MKSIQVWHPLFEERFKSHSTLDYDTILHFLECKKCISKDNNYTLVFVSCGTAYSELQLATKLIENGYTIANIWLMDKNIVSSTLRNAQLFLTTQCPTYSTIKIHLIFSLSDLINNIQEEADSRFVIIGIHEQLNCSTDTQMKELVDYYMLSKSIQECRINFMGQFYEMPMPSKFEYIHNSTPVTWAKFSPWIEEIHQLTLDMENNTTLGYDTMDRDGLITYIKSQKNLYFRFLNCCRLQSIAAILPSDKITGFTKC